MKKKYNIFVISLLPIFFFCCSKQTKTVLETIFVDVDNAQSIDISSGKLIELETTDSSLLYEISNIEFLNDKLIVLSREEVLVFNNRSGKFLFKVGKKGQAPHEYINLAAIFVKDNFIYLLDHMSKKILCFDENGNFINSMKLKGSADCPISDLFPLNNGDYMAKNQWWGGTKETWIGSIWDKDFQFVKSITGKHILTGLTSNDNFSQFENRILYWEFLNDTVFAVEDYQTMHPQYYVDFGKYAIPSSERVGKDVYDLADYVNKEENMNKIATLVGNVSETNEYLLFRFGFKRHTHYVFYGKQNKDTHVFRFEDKSNLYETQAFCLYHQGFIYLSVASNINIEDNPSLIVFDKNKFIEK